MANVVMGIKAMTKYTDTGKGKFAFYTSVCWRTANTEDLALRQIMS